MAEWIIEPRDTVEVWTIAGEARRNMLTTKMVEELERHIADLHRRRHVRAVVLTGQGDKAFCAGADLKFVRGEAGDDETALSRFLDTVLLVMNRLETFPMPVIASLNGLTLAGGLELMLCCDLVVAARAAKLGDAHANYGLLPGGGSSVRLPRKIGPTRAKYLLYTGEFVPADQLVAAGLVNEVVDDSALITATEALVAKLANKSPLVLRRMKALVDDGLEQPAAIALRQELLASEVHACSHDMKEGLAAFEEKRKPRFTGK